MKERNEEREMRERERERERERGATRHKHSIAWHGISIDIYTVSMGISTRSDSGRTPPNTADSDPARSTQTRESIVAFKLPSYSGGLSLPEFRATSGRIRTGNTHVKISSLVAHYRCVLTVHVVRVRVSCPSFMREKKSTKGEERKIDPEERAVLTEQRAVRGLTRSRTGHPVGLTSGAL